MQLKAAYYIYSIIINSKTMAYLIADSGATKCEWCLVINNKTKKFSTQGISPYFLSKAEIIDLLSKEVLKKTAQKTVDNIYFYGTGLSNSANITTIKSALKTVFPTAKADMNTDILAAARALLKHNKGIACILGTGSNSCYYNGKKL